MQAATKAAARRRSVTRRRLTLIVGLALLGIAILAVLLAPVLVSQSPKTIDPLHPLAPPLTPDHLLGTDQYGRDMLARILYGGRIDLAIAFGATSVTLVCGTIYRPGRRLHRRPRGQRDDAHGRPVLRVPVPGPGHRDHRDARAEHLQHVRRDLDHQLGRLRADHARPDRGGQEAAVRAGRARPRVRPAARHVPAHPAQHGLRGDHLLDGRRGREHHPGRLARLPRARRPAARPRSGGR